MAIRARAAVLAAAVTLPVAVLAVTYGIAQDDAPPPSVEDVVRIGESGTDEPLPVTEPATPGTSETTEGMRPTAPVRVVPPPPPIDDDGSGHDDDGSDDDDDDGGDDAEDDE